LDVNRFAVVVSGVVLDIPLFGGWFCADANIGFIFIVVNNYYKYTLNNS
jgi:hypothetical protein